MKWLFLENYSHDLHQMKSNLTLVLHIKSLLGVFNVLLRNFSNCLVNSSTCITFLIINSHHGEYSDSQYLEKTRWSDYVYKLDESTL